MIIDAHVHVCPDKIAEASAKVFFERNNWSWIYDGTVGTFIRLMDENEISKGIMANVVVKPDLLAKSNDFTASKVKEFPDRLIGFAFIHPGYKDPPGEVERCVKIHGFSAVKINGSLLRFYPEDERMLPVYEKAMELGVTIMTHCGPNVENFQKAPEEIKEKQYAEPKSWIPVLKRFPDLKLILAHFAGSTHYYDDALEVLRSFPEVYVDCSMVLATLTPDEATSFVNKIGVDRVVFGTDYPGHDVGKEIELVKKLGLTDEEKEKIFSKNIIKFLEIDV